MTGINSETVAKNRKRGRPLAFPIGETVATASVWGDLVGTRRGLTNKMYAKAGAMAVCPCGQRNPRHAWFANERRVRQAVLVELGRIARRYGAQTARDMADRLADKVAVGELSTTREAAAWLRQARLRQSGCRKPARADVLEKVITTTIINWIAEHPDAKPALVGEALSRAYSLVEILEDLKERKSAIVSETQVEDVAP